MDVKGKIAETEIFIFIRVDKVFTGTGTSNQAGKRISD